MAKNWYEFRGNLNMIGKQYKGKGGIKIKHPNNYSGKLNPALTQKLNSVIDNKRMRDL